MADYRAGELDRTHASRVAIAAAVAAIVLVVWVLGLGVGLASAGTDEVDVVPTTTSTTFPEPGKGVPGNIIPDPDAGIAPERPGDRGGWQQWAVLGAIFVGLGSIVVLVARESQRKRSGRP